MSKKPELINHSQRDELAEVQAPYFLSEEEAYKYCQETGQLSRGLKVGYMLLSQRLHRIKKQKLYKPEHEHFYMYCDDIGISETIASKLIGIYEKFCIEFGIELDEVKNLDYTKLYLIKPISETKELAEHWIEEAKVLTVKDLKSKIRSTVKDVDQMKCEHHDTYLVRCCRECGETWEEYADTVNMSSEEREIYNKIHKHE